MLSLKRFPTLGTLLTLSLVALLTACAPQSSEDAASDDSAAATFAPTEAELASAKAINAGGITEHVLRLSGDAMEGRGPASEGDRKAREYIAQKLETFGYQPAFDTGWDQPFEVVSIEAQSPDTWDFLTADDTVTMKFWDDFIAGSGVQSETAALNGAEVVFVGYGIEAPEYGWNDYKDVDVSGKVLLMLNNDPDWSADLFEGDRRLYYGRWTYKYEIAAAKGAAGAIIIHTSPSAGYPWQVVQTSWTGPQFELPASPDEPRVQVAAWLTNDAAARLAAAGGQDLEALREAARSKDFQPVSLAATTSLYLTNALARVETANVGGVLPGSDPELADEAVVYTAHHDHLGIGRANDEGDSIYNGARDNAAGTGQLLEVAEAIAALPERPRRSTLILAVGAEEQGLLGAKYYAANPTFHAGRLAANVNFDAPGIWGRTKDLPLVGFGKSTLDNLTTRIAEFQGRTVRGEVDPTQGSYYRSDQFAFAKIGVPALYMAQGTEFLDPNGPTAEALGEWNRTHYHQPSDEFDITWNLEGAAENAQLGFFVGLTVSNTDTLPAWNPGDEFEAARKAALAEVAGE
ncbi:MAG: M28 family peptidase [Acidobacteriota bacterium]